MFVMENVLVECSKSDLDFVFTTITLWRRWNDVRDIVITFIFN